MDKEAMGREAGRRVTGERDAGKRGMKGREAGKRDARGREAIRKKAREQGTGGQEAGNNKATEEKCLDRDILHNTGASTARQKRHGILFAICAVSIVFLMAGTSNLLGQREVIFPEVAAICVGYFAAPKRPWAASKIWILALISFSAVLGIFIVRFLPGPVWFQMLVAYGICQVALPLSRTTFAPMISAMVLPVLLQTDTLIYPVSAIGFTALLLGIVVILEKAGLRKKEPYEPWPLPDRMERFTIFYRVGIVALLLFILTNSGFTFAAAPPLLVAFTEFTKPEHPAAKRPFRSCILLFLSASCGALVRFAVSMQLGLPTAFAAAITMAAILVLMKFFSMYLPPCAALGLLAMLIPQEAVPLYPFEAGCGAAIYLVAALAWSKVRSTVALGNTETGLSSNYEE